MKCDGGWQSNTICYCLFIYGNRGKNQICVSLGVCFLLGVLVQQGENDVILWRLLVVNLC
jgi:hypothetical protein